MSARDLPGGLVLDECEEHGHHWHELHGLDDSQCCACGIWLSEVDALSADLSASQNARG